MVSVLFRAVDVLFRPAVLVLTVSSILGLCLTMELAEPSPRDKEVRLKVLTLNCWGVPLYGSKDIDERFQLIGRHFSESDYDILMLQEVWRDADYRTLVRYLHSAFPHFHYFYRLVFALFSSIVPGIHVFGGFPGGWGGLNS